MDGNMILNYGSGGGGAALNFKVVRYDPGAELPASAAENIIAVFTNVDIAGWYFSPTQPENMKQGEVWFLTGASSSVAFNALKKNSIEVCPIYAKQYVNGELVSVEAKTYQNGKWIDWITYLFNNGDECIDITGGWTSEGFTFGTTKVVEAVNSGSLIRMEYSGSGIVAIIKGTKEKINLTNINKIRIRYKCAYNTSASTTMQFGVASGTEVQVNNRAANISLNDTTGNDVDAYLDVSMLDGEYYVVASVYAENSGIKLFAIAEVEYM